MTMQRTRFIILITALTILCSCKNPFSNPFDFGGGDDNDRPDVTPNRVITPAKKLAIAIGGVMPGRDELVIFDSSTGNPRDFGSSRLDCLADSSIIRIGLRSGFSSQAEGSGVAITAIDPGVAAVRCTLDGVDMGDVYEVTVPPQSLIQILVAEAGAQIADEAKIDTSSGTDVVALDSVSPTANAIGSVVRNRIEMINNRNDPALFAVDEKAYDAEAPASYYEAVIEAPDQFSPASKTDPNYEIYSDAQDRNFLDDASLIAYDQAVITAAGIFNGDIEDSAGGSFAFRSPTQDEWNSISQAFSASADEIPANSGFTDATFPDLAPIQLLIVPDVWKYTDGRPSFIFARQRPEGEHAISNAP